MTMPRVTLKPSGRVLEAPRKINLLKFLHDQGIPVGSACGGKGLCASCKLEVLNGEKNLSRPKDKELELLERNGLGTQVRISCQCTILGDIEISAPYW